MTQPVRISAAAAAAAAADRPPAAFALGDWRVFADRNEIEGPGGLFRLEPMSMRLLCLLAEHAGRTVTRAEIVDRLWDGRAVTHDAVTRQIAKLREAFGDDARDPQVVRTVPKVGFRLLLEPQPVRAEPVKAEPAKPEPVPTAPRQPARAPAPRRDLRFWGVVALAAAAVVGATTLSFLRRPVEAASLAQYPLTAEVGLEAEPALSPNGAWLAYVVRPAGETADALYLRTLRGGARRLTPPGVDAHRPAWSPGMTRLAFVEIDARGCVITVMTLTDGPRRPVGACHAADLGGLAWLDADSLVIADRTAPGAGFRLARLDLASGRVRPLTASGVDGPNLGDTDPVVSADGRTVYFVRTSAPGVADVYALTLADGGVRRVTRDGAGIRGLTRGEGRRLVVASNRLSGATYALWSLDARGSDWRRLTDDARVEYPTSPDGRTIAFQRRDRQMSLWSAPLGGGAPRRITATSRSDRMPAVSRDGRLAFLSDRSGVLELWVADANGQPRQVSDFRGVVPREPAWSPDGRSVVLSVRTGEGQFDLARVDVATGALVVLAHTPASERYPTWSGDGRRLYFSRGEGERYALYERSPGGRERRLASDVVRAIEGADGKLYVQRPAVGGFWRFDPADGRLTKIGDLPGADPRSWTLADGAVWALGGPAGSRLLRLDLAGGAVTAVRDLPAVYARAGLAVGGGEVTFARVESENVDIYAVGDRD